MKIKNLKIYRLGEIKLIIFNVSSTLFVQLTGLTIHTSLHVAVFAKTTKATSFSRMQLYNLLQNRNLKLSH